MLLKTHYVQELTVEVWTLFVEVSEEDLLELKLLSKFFTFVTLLLLKDLMMKSLYSYSKRIYKKHLR